VKTHSCRFSSTRENTSNKPKAVENYSTHILKQYFDILRPILNPKKEEVTAEQKELMKKVLAVVMDAYEEGEKNGAWGVALDQLPAVGGFH
jgi:hypothetical protein